MTAAYKYSNKILFYKSSVDRPIMFVYAKWIALQSQGNKELLTLGMLPPAVAFF